MDTVKHSRRHSRGNRGQFGERVETVPPTVETALKLVPDSLSILKPDQYETAKAIVWAHEAIRSCIGPPATRSGSFELRSKSHETDLAKLERLKETHGDAVRRYASWRRLVSRSVIPFSALTAMLIDGVPCWEVDREYNRPPTTAAGWLIEALGYYR
jgi:hypothetical protein